MCVVGNLTGQGISVGKLPGPFVGTLLGPLKTGICRNFAYASLTPSILCCVSSVSFGVVTALGLSVL